MDVTDKRVLNGTLLQKMKGISFLFLRGLDREKNDRRLGARAQEMLAIKAAWSKELVKRGPLYPLLQKEKKALGRK